MKKLWLLSAGLIALSGSMFGDMIYTGAGTTTAGTMVGIPTTSSFVASQLPYTGSAVAPPAVGVPFWNNPSSDGTPPPSPALVDGHIANVGDVLAGLSTGTNLIGSNLSGGNIQGNYFTNTQGGTTDGNAVIPYTSGTSLTPANEFQLVSQGNAQTISLLFADSANDTGVMGSANSIGTYIIFNGNFTEATVLDADVANNTTGTAVGLGTYNNGLVVNTGTVYGFYVNVCYVWSGTACTASVTYTSGNGNFITPLTVDPANTLASGSGWLDALGWNHFAFFQLANGEEALGFTDTPNVYMNAPGDVEGLGDYNDIVLGITGNAGLSTPEPGTIAIMGLGLAGLGLIGRRRFAKK